MNAMLSFLCIQFGVSCLLFFLSNAVPSSKYNISIIPGPTVDLGAGIDKTIDENEVNVNSTCPSMNCSTIFCSVTCFAAGVYGCTEKDDVRDFARMGDKEKCE